MSDAFTLDVSQAAEIKHAVIRAGGTNADLKVLSSGDMFARILPVLRGRAEVVLKSILEKVNTLLLPILSRFVASDYIKVDTSDTAKVKIAFIWDGFKPFLKMVVEEQTPEMELTFHKLCQSSLDKSILDELGDKAETYLSQFWALLEMQGHGQKGNLLVNGNANIFYIRDAENTLWAVVARWGAGSGGWDLSADSVSDPHGWGADDMVVSRN